MTPSSHPVVRTSAGPVRGERRGDSVRFLGLPYAQPPVGELRFAAPVPPVPWTEVREATAYGPTAQRRPLFEVTTIPEPSIPGDGTLNLNVFTPDAAPGAALPVLVWIHGGGFLAGSAASPWYDGAAFNRDGIVVVTIGYRLGIEGFLHLSDAPDNRGVLDWIAALEWVQENIAAFGGDPRKVTVAGQSAGGGAVQTLLATPGARGLFRGAISMSGAVMSPQERETAEAVSRLFTARTGLAATAAALRGRTEDELLALRDQLTAPGPDRDALPMLALAPFADGKLIPQAVPDALAHGGAGTDIPLLAGSTTHEFNAIPHPGATHTDLRALLTGLGLGEEGIRRFLDLYEAPTEADPAALMGQAVTDATFRAPALRLAEGRARASAPTWLYEFGWTGTVLPGLAYHCTDLPFAFDLLDAPGVAAALGDTAPQLLADAMHGAWVSFVRDLDPGRHWPPYTTGGRATMLFGAEARVDEDPLRAVREIWQG
ncbi:carboxylesterase/lipase family protein [Streptomyces indicus]|uniref:Carboxylic ester hydrolase n=1 Tax=Streptomyces indicus TaxID=417292 RepID=A0A1G8TD89_9ACTN|nr:carboxylesterase family protein [Streptomyces indicus]SDJ39403.1 para-nitrobenzyl esterase [Streptomyces indicus]